MMTIRNFFMKATPLLVGLTTAGLLTLGLLGYHALVVAQPGLTPNFAFLRGGALGIDPALVCQGLDTNVDCNIVTQGTGTLLLNGVAIPGISGGAGTFASLTVTTGPNTIAGATAFNGLLTARPGASVVNDGIGAIVLSNSSTNTTTSLVATEQDLFNFSIPANTLSADNQFVVLDIRVRNAATANAKQTRVYFGATLIGNSTSVVNNNDWHIAQCHVWRTGAATQKAICHSNNVANAAAWNTANGGGANISTPAETLSGAVVMRVTGTDAVAAAGTNLEAINLVWYPAGQ